MTALQPARSVRGFYERMAVHHDRFKRRLLPRPLHLPPRNEQTRRLNLRPIQAPAQLRAPLCACCRCGDIGAGVGGGEMMKAAIVAVHLTHAAFCATNDDVGNDFRYHCADTLRDCQLLTDGSSGLDDSGKRHCTVYVHGRWKAIWTWYAHSCILVQGKRLCGRADDGGSN